MPNTGTSPSSPRDGVDGVGDRGRVAGAVGQEDAVGLAGQRRRPPGVDAGTTSTVAEPAEVAQDRALDAEVVGHDPAAAPSPTV